MDLQKDGLCYQPTAHLSCVVMLKINDVFVDLSMSMGYNGTCWFMFMMFRLSFNEMLI